MKKIRQITITLSVLLVLQLLSFITYAQNEGIFDQNVSMVDDGHGNLVVSTAWLKSFKNGGGNVCNAQLSFTIDGGAANIISIPFGNNIGGGNPGDQFWGNSVGSSTFSIVTPPACGPQTAPAKTVAIVCTYSINSGGCGGRPVHTSVVLFNVTIAAVTTTTPTCPLPVSLTNFDATINKNIATLKWSTATENDLNYFGIEKSYDGNNFFALAKVNAAGNSSFTKNYFYNDALNATDKIVYYKLKLVDRNGTFKYSNTVAVANQNNTTDITVLPNPTQNFIVLNGSKAGNVISITNAIGASVINQVLTTDNQIINTQKLQSGVYYIKILKANTVVTKQFVVAK